MALAPKQQRHRYVAYLRGARQLGEHSIDQILSALNRFTSAPLCHERFHHLAEQKGFRGRMARTDADYFKPSRRDDAIARAPRQMPRSSRSGRW